MGDPLSKTISHSGGGIFVGKKFGEFTQKGVVGVDSGW